MKFQQDDVVYYKGKIGIINQTMTSYNKPTYKVYFPIENKVIEFIDEKELSYK